MSSDADGTGSLVDRAFPFHLAVDHSLGVIEAGPRLKALIGDDLIGRYLGEIARIERPVAEFDFAHLKKAVGEVQVLEILKKSGLRLRGEFLLDEVDSREILRFVGHPWIMDLVELQQLGLDLHDFPPHAGLADLLILLQARSNSIEDMRRLAAQLRATSNTLAERNAALEMELETRKRLEMQLQQAQKMDAIGRLAGGVAHDFNNVLLAITGHATLARKAASPEGMNRHIEKIFEAADRAADITSRLLAFARRKRLEVVDVDLKSAIFEAASMLGPLIGERIELSINCDPNAGSIRTDRVALQQVVMNLVVNARDAMPDGGLIEVHAHAESSLTPKVLFSGERDAGDWGVISISDHGTGIDPDDLGRVFEPFFTTKNLGEGTGLGLATVWWIVKESGGVIDLNSSEGKGTKITIHLPAGKNVVQKREQSKADTFPREPILVVEDDDMVRLPMVECLRTLGCTVESARDGVEALAIASSSEHCFGYLLSDLIMPSLNGRELAQKLREYNPSIKVVFMSGYDPEPIKGSNDGANDIVLIKPFTIDDLREAFSEAR